MASSTHDPYSTPNPYDSSSTSEPNPYDDTSSTNEPYTTGRCAFGFPELICKEEIWCIDDSDCERFQDSFSTSFSACVTTNEEFPPKCDGEDCFWETTCKFDDTDCSLSPYHVEVKVPGALDVLCKWSCGEGTTPDDKSYECVCKEGFWEYSIDQFGRRMCTQYDCWTEEYWTDAKSEWCCAHQGQGCPEQEDWDATWRACPAWATYAIVNCPDADSCTRDPTEDEAMAMCAEYETEPPCADDPLAQKHLEKPCNGDDSWESWIEISDYPCKTHGQEDYSVNQIYQSRGLGENGFDIYQGTSNDKLWIFYDENCDGMNTHPPAWYLTDTPPNFNILENLGGNTLGQCTNAMKIYEEDPFPTTPEEINVIYRDEFYCDEGKWGNEYTEQGWKVKVSFHIGKDEDLDDPYHQNEDCITLKYSGPEDMPQEINGKYFRRTGCEAIDGGDFHAFTGADYHICYRNDHSFVFWNTGCGWEIGRHEMNEDNELSWKAYASTYYGNCEYLSEWDNIIPESAIFTNIFFDVENGNLIYDLYVDACAPPGRCAFGFPELFCKEDIWCNADSDCESFQDSFSTSFSACVTTNEEFPSKCDGEDCFWETTCKFDDDISMVCTEDVMVCWDGSIVSRDPLNSCAFDECPPRESTTSIPYPNTSEGDSCSVSNQDCGKGMFCNHDYDDIGHCNSCEGVTCPPRHGDRAPCCEGYEQVDTSCPNDCSEGEGLDSFTYYCDEYTVFECYSDYVETTCFEAYDGCNAATWIT
jgi:hypothetical protein